MASREFQLDTDKSGLKGPAKTSSGLDIDLEPLVLGVLDSLNLPDHILVETDVRLSQVHGDRHAIECTLGNVLSNAVRDCVREDGRISIVCDLRRGCCLVTVEDRSTGPAPHMKSPRFVSLSPGDALQRSGASLVDTRRMVEENGGKLSIEPAGTLRGATYRLWWPAPEGMSSTAIC